jgi:hypothetical protein
MSGVALANQARLSRSDLRVLILEDGRKGTNAQNDTPPEYFVLNKPVTPDLLAATVRSILDTPASMPLS